MNTTIKEIRQKLIEIKNPHDPFLQKLSIDSRQGVKDLLLKWHRRYEKEKAAREQFENMLTFENKAKLSGFKLIAGIDEVGRGPIAGPVVSAAVILPDDCKLIGLNDSKKLTEKKREDLYSHIMTQALSVGIGIVSHEEIDRINIYEATKKSMLLAVNNLCTTPDYLLIDAVRLNTIYPEESITKGDMKSASIAAASIIAKVTRDRIMTKIHNEYPMYGFNIHKGYGTKHHLEMIRKYGPALIHRRSFAPIKDWKKGG